MNTGIRQNTPLALKMAAVMLLVVITAWFAAHHIETGVMKDFLFQYHLENLTYDAKGELLRFIKYLRAHTNSVRSLVLQKNFDDHIKTFDRNTEAGIILHHDRLPSWFPPPSLTRAHLRYAYALLVDPGGSVLEVYNGMNETIPESLRNPDELLPRLQSTESVITYIEGEPYQLVVQHFPYPGSSRPGSLMFAFRINSDFLKASQGAIFGNHIVALVDTSEQILVSSEPDLIQPGESLSTLETGYLLTKKSFFDYGESEIDIRFVSLVPKSDIDALIHKVLSMELKHGVAYGFTFIFTSTLVVIMLAGRIKKVSRGIAQFLQGNFGTKYAAPPGGDELYTLETSFNHLKEEVLDHQARLKESRNRLESINKELAQKIMEHRQAETQIQMANKEWQTTFDSIFQFVSIHDSDSRILKVNKAFSDAFKVDRDEVKGKKCFEIMHEKITRPWPGCPHKRTLETGEPFSEEIFEPSLGIYLQMSTSPIFSDDGEIIGSVHISEDINERKKVEHALMESEEKYRRYFRSVPTAWAYHKIIVDKSGHPTDYIFLEVNEAFERQTGLKSDRIIGKKVTEVIPGITQDRTDWIGIYGDVALNGKTIKFENYSKVLNRWFRISASSPAQGLFITVFDDITESKKMERQIKASLREKEVLLKEIHHRVKNNMQVISSLLNLQSDYIKDEQYQIMFSESRNRINSMALVHEMLYKSSDLANIDFRGYVESLTNSLFAFYGIHPGTISPDLHIEDIMVSIETATPCGLIINELVSNSLKYAFPDRQQGALRITFQKTLSRKGETGYILIVSDNGAGMPEGLDIRKTPTLGLQLVTNLVEHQLQGNIKLGNSQGTEFIITFGELVYKRRI